MMTLRRARVAVLAVPVLLAGCASGDVLDGTGTVGSGSRSADFPSGSASVPDPSGSPGGGGGSSAAAPSVSSVPGGSTAPLKSYSKLTGAVTTLEFAPSFLSALTALKLTPALIGTARLTGSSVVFRITGGSAVVYPTTRPDPVTASVQHVGGGLSLTNGKITAALTDLQFQLGATSKVLGTLAVNAKPIPEQVTLFDLDTSAVRTLSSGGYAGVFGLGVRISAQLASTLNASFGTAVFTSAVPVGEARLTITGS